MMRSWLSRGPVLAMRIGKRVSRRVGSSEVRSPLMGTLRGNCRSHHEVLGGDRGELLALDVNDVRKWRRVDVEVGDLASALAAKLSVVFKNRG
jgi:hypothetical protein